MLQNARVSASPVSELLRENQHRVKLPSLHTQIRVNKYNNRCHTIIKMKPVDVKQSTYIDSSKEINDKDPKCKIGDIVGLSKYKNVFANGYVSNWLLVILKMKKLLERLAKKNCKKQTKNCLELKK